MRGGFCGLEKRVLIILSYLFTVAASYAMCALCTILHSYYLKYFACCSLCMNKNLLVLRPDRITEELFPSRGNASNGGKKLTQLSSSPPQVPLPQLQRPMREMMLQRAQHPRRQLPQLLLSDDSRSLEVALRSSCLEEEKEEDDKNGYLIFFVSMYIT